MTWTGCLFQDKLSCKVAQTIQEHTMVDRPDDPSTPEPGSVDTGMPAWVRYLLIGVAVAAAVVVIAMVLLGGDHGPGRHG